MATQQKSAVNIVLGAMTFGEAGHVQSRVHDLATVDKIMATFKSHGHVEIDTARVYSDGTSEQYLHKNGWEEKGFKVATKIHPTAIIPGFTTEAVSHGPEDLRKVLKRSLEALGTDKIDLWYLHSPDRNIPYEVTLKGINELYKEGLFTRWGLSNYMSWEVAQIVELCEAHNYVKPAVYQGLYNAIHRQAEVELFKCLRHYNIAFYAFNPLGGGFFTGNMKKDTEVEPGSRFDAKNWQGKGYRVRYWNDAYFEALEIVRPVADKYNLTLAETALRWMTHHSLLKREFGDAIIIGASSTKHIEQNLFDLDKPALPEEVVRALDEAWKHVKGVAIPYFR